MSTSINQAFLCGRLGQDPNVRALSDGTKVCDFSLATGGEKWTNKDGKEIETPTQWHNIVCWRGLAELAEKYLKKGHAVTIIGEITYRQYEDKDGVKRFATDIIASDMFLGGAPSGGNGQKAADPSQYAQPSQQQKPIAPMQEMAQPAEQPSQPTQNNGSDDLPF